MTNRPARMDAYRPDELSPFAHGLLQKPERPDHWVIDAARRAVARRVVREDRDVAGNDHRSTDDELRDRIETYLDMLGLLPLPDERESRS